MKIAYVVHRYGPDIRGGAEAHCRDYARRLAALGHEVHVLTTRASDYRTWRNDLPEGTSIDAGVTVHRYHVAQERPADFDAFCAEVLANPLRVPRDVQERWMQMQGPVVPELFDALRSEASTFDLVVFVTYLYCTTFYGLVVSAHKSAKLAIKQANAKGDLPVTIELVALDNKDGAANTAPALAQRLIADQAVVGVIGPAFSGETRTTGALFCEAGLAHVTQSATAPDLTKNGWKTFFRGLASDDVQGGQTGDYIVKGLDKKNIAVINDKSEYGAALAKVVVDSIKKAGGTVVLDQGIEPTTDYTSIVDSVIAKKPDVLYYAGYDKDAPLLAKQHKAKGGTAIFMGGDGDKGTNFLKEGGSAVEGAILTCPCLDPNASSDAAAQKFASDYKAEYGGEEAGIYSSEAWDVTQMFIAAIKAGGANVTRKSVLDYISNLKDYKGLSKTFNWDENREVIEGDITYVYEVKGGKYTLLGRADELAK